MSIAQIRSSVRRTPKISSISKSKSTKVNYGRCELDSHADTIVAGSNCVILGYTGRVCDVSPYREDYESVKDVPIVQAATAWYSQHTGQTYILVFNEVLWMGDSMDHSLINPNQLRHYGIEVQDNPTSTSPLSIQTEDREFYMDLMMDGTIIHAETHSPTEEELHSCMMVQLTSQHPWDPSRVKFPVRERTWEEKPRQMSTIVTSFSIESINRAICSMQIIVPDKIFRNHSIDSGKSDVSTPNTFQSSERHADISPENLSDRWGISIPTAIKTIKKTTQRFMRSAILPLSRRYRVDRVFSRKTLNGDWSTDTLDGRCKSLEGNRYAQVFANKHYFSRIYPMDSKKKAGDTLRLFCQEFGVPEKLIFDGSKEQTEKGTEFMKQIRTHNINHHICEPGYFHEIQ